MNTPPLLLGAALLFWGWQCGLFWVGALLALALEISRVITARWELAQADLDRVWNLCIVVVCAAVVIAFASSEGASAVAGLLTKNSPANRVAALSQSGRSLLLFFQWMPMTLFPIVAAQAFGTQPRIDWSTFSWWLRRMRGRPVDDDPMWRGGLNVTYPYLALTLTSASAANQHGSWFFAGLSALLAWAVWARRPRAFSAATSAVGLLVVIGLGYAGQFGLVGLRKAIEHLDSALVSRFAGSKFNARESRTMLGSIGRLKLSGKIVLRVTLGRNPPPTLLREASYNLFKAPVWAASRKDFSGVTSEKDGTTWILSPEPSATRALTISSLLPGGEGILALPLGSTRLERLPLYLETNRFGAAHAVSGPGYLEYVAHYADRSTIDALPDGDDRECPPEERFAIAQIASELDLAAATPEGALAKVERFFAERFRYSTWLTEEHRPRTHRTALAAFLLDHRSGHCEYFATATTLLLRQAGIPARYAVGYSVQERKGRTYIIRQRHAHAWCLAWVNGAWREVDTTPGSWHEVEGSHSSVWEPLGDLWSRLSFAFSKWRWSEGGFKKYLVWLVVPLTGLLAVQLFLKRQWNRSRSPDVTPAVAKRWPGLESEFYRIERRLRDAGLERRPEETLSAWLKRAEDVGAISSGHGTPAGQGTSHFCARDRAGVVPTPHPGPLPVEGRGGANRRRGDEERAARVPTALVLPTKLLKTLMRWRSTSARSETPSPLNGERAGVRGENETNPTFPPIEMRSSADLRAALALHYRLRFDPAGLPPEERIELKSRVESWESAATVPRV